MTQFVPTSPADREAAAVFIGRVAQLDPAAIVRLVGCGTVGCGTVGCGTVDLWARGGFGVVATTRVAGLIDPNPLTAYATNLVAALAVSRSDAVHTGTDATAQWHTQLPPPHGWVRVGTLSTREIADEVRAATVIAEQAVQIERVNELRAKTKATVPPAILDRVLMSVPVGTGRVPVSMRMLFALSGMGFADASMSGEIGVATTRTWLRLDSPLGSVARRRMADLPPR